MVGQKAGGDAKIVGDVGVRFERSRRADDEPRMQGTSTSFGVNIKSN